MSFENGLIAALTTANQLLETKNSSTSLISDKEKAAFQRLV